MSAWRHIETLARPTVPPGDSDVLVAACARGVRGIDALDALQRWSDDRGGLPDLASLDVSADRVTHLWPVVRSALESATDIRAFAAVGYLGHRLVAEGRAWIDAMQGLGIVRLLLSRAKELG